MLIETAGDDSLHHTVVQTMLAHRLAWGAPAKGCASAVRAAATGTWNSVTETWSSERGIVPDSSTGS